MGERELEHVSTPATRLLVGCMAISYTADELEHIAEELKDAAAAKRRAEPERRPRVALEGVFTGPDGKPYALVYLPEELPRLEQDGYRLVPDPDSQVCRMCGCTDERACIEISSGQPCSWTEPGLCSACDPIGGPGLAIRSWSLANDPAPAEPGDNL